MGGEKQRAEHKADAHEREMARLQQQVQAMQAALGEESARRSEAEAVAAAELMMRAALETELRGVSAEMASSRLDAASAMEAELAERQHAEETLRSQLESSLLGNEMLNRQLADVRAQLDEARSIASTKEQVSTAQLESAQQEVAALRAESGKMASERNRLAERVEHLEGTASVARRHTQVVKARMMRMMRVVEGELSMRASDSVKRDRSAEELQAALERMREELEHVGEQHALAKGEVLEVRGSLRDSMEQHQVQQAQQVSLEHRLQQEVVKLSQEAWHRCRRQRCG